MVRTIPLGSTGRRFHLDSILEMAYQAIMAVKRSGEKPSDQGDARSCWRDIGIIGKGGLRGLWSGVLFRCDFGYGLVWVSCVPYVPLCTFMGPCGGFCTLNSVLEQDTRGDKNTISRHDTQATVKVVACGVWRVACVRLFNKSTPQTCG